MFELLLAVAPQLAALLRASADYLDTLDEESEFDQPPSGQPTFQLDERGQVVLR